MKKLRCDSKWSRLPPDAKRQVIKWLFEDNLSYKVTLERAQKEFGIQSSIPSLARYYQHVVEEREAAGVNLPDISPEEFRTAAHKLLGLAAVRAGRSHDSDNVTKRFIPLVKLLLDQDDRELKGKWLELELERMEHLETNLGPKN